MTGLAVLEETKRAITSDVSLGRLMWYSVTDDTRVDHSTLLKELNRVGLNLTIPPFPREHNVFRRVSSNAERKLERPKAKMDDPTIIENWMVRDVAGRGETVIARRIVCELRDAKNRKLGYEQIADVEFDRGTNKLSFRWLQDENGVAYTAQNRPTAHDMWADINAEFHKWKGHLNHYAIREWIRKTILEMGATAVRPSGGVYFLREEHAAKVEALEEFVAALPGNNECHSLPVVDTDKQRKMVRKALEAETNDAIDHLLSEIREIKTEGKLTPQRYAQLIAEHKRLSDKTRDYQKLLEQETREIDSRLTILKRQTMSLSSLQRRARSKDDN